MLHYNFSPVLWTAVAGNLRAYVLPPKLASIWTSHKVNLSLAPGIWMMSAPVSPVYVHSTVIVAPEPTVPLYVLHNWYEVGSMVEPYSGSELKDPMLKSCSLSSRKRLNMYCPKEATFLVRIFHVFLWRCSKLELRFTRKAG